MLCLVFSNLQATKADSRAKSIANRTRGAGTIVFDPTNSARTRGLVRPLFLIFALILHNIFIWSLMVVMHY